VQIKQASDIGESVRSKLGAIFADGFSQWLQYFSKDNEKLALAFAHMFILDAFYVAVVDGEIAGFAACTHGKTPAVRLDSRELRRHLGLLRGSFAGMMLKKELENHLYPFPIQQGTGSIEFVATDKKYRGKGVASSIIRHITSATAYRSYVLEVADTNTPAVSLYRQLGFKEFFRVRHKHSKYSGINFMIYMKYDKSEADS
jgi:ribosomal protein S18 acetylase RimI-like enzyme